MISLLHVGAATVLVFSVQPLLQDAHLDALRPTEQLQMFLQKSTETSSRAGRETRRPSKLAVVTHSILAGREQRGRVAQPLPLSCTVEENDFIDTFKCPVTEFI